MMIWQPISRHPPRRASLIHIAPGGWVWCDMFPDASAALHGRCRLPAVKIEPSLCLCPLLSSFPTWRLPHPSRDLRKCTDFFVSPVSVLPG